MGDPGPMGTTFAPAGPVGSVVGRLDPAGCPGGAVGCLGAVEEEENEEADDGFLVDKGRSAC